MSYKNQRADKSSHSDIIENSEVKRFLSEECNYLVPPSKKEGEKISSNFKKTSLENEEDLPKYIFAVDGSRYESSIADQLPTTRVGYVKIGNLVIDLTQFNSLKTRSNRFVDPFAIARLQDDNDSLTFTLPSSNITLENKGTVRDSFRKKVDEHLYKHRTKPNDPATSLRTTLFYLASLRSGKLGTEDSNKLKLHKCPHCGNKEVEVENIPPSYEGNNPQVCDNCGQEVYPADCLRLWEEVSEHQSNITALTRFMNLIEHLLPIHYIRILDEVEESLNSLSEVAFIVDGPLAMFGPSAWLTESIMKFLSKINQKLEEINKKPILLIGLQKTGQIVEHTKLINEYLSFNSLLAVDDDYRYEYIIPNRKRSSSYFGKRTYYGQDFIYKTSSGRIFVFSLPYPFSKKPNVEKEVEEFLEEVIKYDNYLQLDTALALIKEFECDLYENAVIPIALAHRYTSISLEPGGRALDLLTREELGCN